MGYRPAADGVGYGVGDGGGDRGVAAFANAFALERGGAAGRLQQDRYQFREVFDGGDFVIAEAEGADLPGRRFHFLHQGIAQALNDAALNLPLVGLGVQHGADIVGGNDFVDGYLAGFRVNFHFGGLGAVGGVFGGGRSIGFVAG